MTITFVDEARAIDSLRKSDFDAVSAYCEVIDNSIQADSKNINVMFVTQPVSSGYYKINNVIFGDDGIGMDFDTLYRCLKLGWSSRFNSQKGIGRFGVGMTLAAIHECKRVEVYSKTLEPAPLTRLPLSIGNTSLIALVPVARFCILVEEREED